MLNSAPALPQLLIQTVVSEALVEDRAKDDITTDILQNKNLSATGQFIAKEEGLICGLQLVIATFERLDKTVICDFLKADGDTVKKNELIGTVKGNASAILQGERVALNFLQHLSGIATLTNQFVRLSKNDFMILDTRKTTPGLRDFEKYAVRCGGGVNHRRDLNSMAMLKDNHLSALNETGITLKEAVQSIKIKNPDVLVEIEVDTITEIEEAVNAQPEWILLDNMTPSQIRECVALINGRTKIEASGGINLENLPSLVKTGIDAVSIGALTHSFKALDISLECIFQS